MKTLLSAVNLDTPVRLNEHTDSYSVVYGADVYTTMSFKKALERFNACVVHSAECAGLLDSEGNEL